jgi:hypothetical protein
MIDDEFEAPRTGKLEKPVDTRHEVRGRKRPEASPDGAPRHLSASRPSDVGVYRVASSRSITARETYIHALR